MSIASKCLKKGMPFVAVLSICHKVCINKSIVQLQTIKWYLVLAFVLTLVVTGTPAVALYAHSSLSGRAIIWVGSAVSPTNRSIVLRAAGTWMRDNPSKNIFSWMIRTLSVTWRCWIRIWTLRAIRPHSNVQLLVSHAMVPHPAHKVYVCVSWFSYINMSRPILWWSS